MGSAELEHVITARIGAVKDIPYELLGSNTSNKAVVVKGTVFGEAIETQPSTWTTRGGKPQAIWTGDSRELRWVLHPKQLTEAKSQNPKVRLQFFLLSNSNPSAPVLADMGVVMLDIRDLQAAATAQEKWHSLSGGRRIEAAVVAQMTTNFPSMRPPSAQRRTPSRRRRSSHREPDAPHDSERGGAAVAGNQLSSSIASDSSALKLGGKAERRRIELMVGIVESRNTDVIEAESGTEAWFAYQLFGETVQTNKFRLDGESVPARNDVFSLDTDPAFLSQWLHDNSPLKVFLCTDGQVLAKACMPLADVELPSSGVDHGAALTFDCALVVPRPGQRSMATDASVAVSVSVTFPDARGGRAQETQAASATSRPPTPQQQQQQQHPTDHGRRPHRPAKATAAGAASLSPPRMRAPEESCNRHCSVVIKQLQVDAPDDDSVSQMVGSEGFYTCVQLNREVVYSTQSGSDRLQGGEYGEIDITEDIPHGETVVSCDPHLLSVRVKCISTESRKVFATGEETIELSWGTRSESELSPRTVAVPLMAQGARVGEAVVQLAPGSVLEPPRPAPVAAPQQQPPPAAEHLTTANKAMATTMHEPGWQAQTAPVAADDDQPLHEYRLMIDARSMRKMAAGGHYLAQFTYPHLGSAQPVRSVPTLVQRNAEVELERGYCTYTVTMLPDRLQDTLNRYPLQISVLQRDHLGEAKVGEVVVDMGWLLRDATVMYRCPLSQQTFKTMDQYQQHAARMTVAYPDQKQKLQRPFAIRVYDAYLPIVDAASKSGKDHVGSLRLVMTQENLGPSATAAPPRELVQPTVSEPLSPASPPASAAGPAQATAPAVVSPSDNSDDEAAATAKLRLLQQQQEQAHAETLRMKEEMQRMVALSEQAREAEAQRLGQLQKAQHEYERLEFKLRQALEETERRQRELKSAEEATKARYEQKMAEAQLFQKRAREEARAAVETEKAKVAALEERVKGLQEDLQRTDKRYADAVQEFEQYRQAMRSHPEQKLREEMVQLRTQLADVQAKLEREQAEKHKAELEKEQFRIQMHRLAAALKRERAKASIASRQEAEQLRLEYLAREERYILDGNRQELSAIRAELDRLRVDVESRPLQNGLNLKSSADSQSETGERSTQSQRAVQAVPTGSDPQQRKAEAPR